MCFRWRGDVASEVSSLLNLTDMRPNWRLRPSKTLRFTLATDMLLFVDRVSRFLKLTADQTAGEDSECFTEVKPCAIGSFASLAYVVM